MESQVSVERAPVCDDEKAAATACHTCLFYEDSSLAARVVPVLERVVRGYRRVVRFELYLWPMDVLRQAHLADRATACCDVTDVVAVAAHGNDGLCEEMHRWLELWDERGAARAGRLLALFHPRSPDRLPIAPAFRDLSAFAVRTGVGLIWCDLPAEGPVTDRQGIQALAG